MELTSGLPSRLLVAIGGNATHPAGIKGTPEEQVEIAEATGRSLLPLLELDNVLVLTHGNGPVVGKIMMRQVLCRDRVPPMSLDICVAHSQGGIGYVLMQALENALRGAGSSRHVMSLLTQVEVDPDDPAFGNFTKPIEGFYTEEQARGLERELGWRMREDAGRGWRHVVPSPVPQRIVDVALIRGLAETGTVVIAAGGGGIPVVSGSAGGWSGIEAVIDKDLTSALMANALGIDDLIILTAVPGVFLDYGRPAARMIRRATVSELHAYSDEGHFPPGSMRPKIEAALQFLKRGGRRVVIAQLDEALSALRGEAGTQIVPDGS